MKLALVSLFAFLQYAVANVEKTVFISPTAQPPPQDASIDNLLLVTLSEGVSTFRTELEPSFPTKSEPHGTVHWFLLEGLRPTTRYEVRICWMATQPTSFFLQAYDVDTAFANAELLTSLSDYSYKRHDKLTEADKELLQRRKASPNEDSTYLFLQIFAAADYYSLNNTLMTTPPPVAVDIILDRYIFNIFPRSLLSTGLYLVLLAVGAWFLSGWISALLVKPPNAEEISKKTD
ncbi:hypothetical protein LTR10_022077 [Elasticomyces elasticus]|uniref:Uncharacterized protein n=1 Tax=Exophiala sideris TaxID=1016849 RepID=A0ABR0JMG7_9EURO|nr:hypothetical protein LTR10_022077 [Elasticomyces elasticus]KAK5037677.1 hypothetical protein LTS07_001144 [Exophiala sideris]KAK5043659.1 hypothetical protein LTR13_000013 [Exophiala sideris]KAK5067158.1 hypothetical protein LTR69_001145 [Exophiala sideris]KAK5182491.1 hypothetical protein LTR44_004882 [Eurotiomycetes sp. CCFEE 6388]